MEQIHDLEEARLVIDMKNDQIQSLQNSIKMTEIKANKSIAQANYRVTTEKNKAEQFKKQAERTKEELTKLKTLYSLSQDNTKQLEVKLQAQAREWQQKLKQEREQFKTHASQLRQVEISMQQTKQENNRINKQLKSLKRIVNSNKLFELTGKCSLDDLPTYPQLMTLLKEKADIVTELREKLQEVTDEVLGVAVQKQKTLSSYEEQLEGLMEEKMRLKNELQAQSSAIRQKEQELDNYRQLLDESKMHHQAIEQMAAQLDTYRNSVPVSKHKDSDDGLRVIHQITMEFEEKEQKYQKQIEQLQRQLAAQQTARKACQRQFGEQNRILKLDLEQLNAVVRAMTSEKHSLEEMLQTLRSQTETFEKHFQRMKSQVERWRRQAEDTVKSSNDLRAQLNALTEQSRQRQLQLRQQNQSLKKQFTQLSQQEETRRYSRLSLDVCTKEEKDWEFLYKSDVKSHNKFLMQLHSLLTK